MIYTLDRSLLGAPPAVEPFAVNPNPDEFDRIVEELRKICPVCAGQGWMFGPGVCGTCDGGGML